ncbi:uncharacterized protein LOC129224722 isoform X1 [Uloborus diversus]|uniref:uncharacterized protein LOC129224722 isoform X1 n=1 Tax=Uloborus diversus TaxID=327109 RepID=UPI0024093CC7|nr:uncharacterized protein LOC129224722 isoform X1 [Uloborus diversus]XP_054715245.1 uncharacterized protein LOC129224722 isoform X1 [Uloborus diversus]
MIIICRTLLLLLLVTFVCRTKTETQWENNNNDAEEEEEEKKSLNAVAANASSEYSRSPDDDEAEESINPTEMQFVENRRNYQNAESNLSEFDRLEVNKFANDASPENTVDQSSKREILVNRMENESELETTAFAFHTTAEGSVTEKTPLFIDDTTSTYVTTVTNNRHRTLKVTEVPLDVDTSKEATVDSDRDLTVSANTDNDKKVTPGVFPMFESRTGIPKFSDKSFFLSTDVKITLKDSTNLETTENSTHNESTTESSDCIFGDEKCKRSSIVPTSSVLSRVRDKFPFWASSSPSSPFPSIWSSAKAPKPTDRVTEDVPKTSTLVKTVPDVISTTPLFFQTTTAQTSENVIVVEGSVADKDESAQQNYLNKNDKVKQTKPNESVTNLTEDRPIRNFPKIVSTTPIFDTRKNFDNDETLTTKMFDAKNADPDLVTLPNTRVWTLSPNQTASHSSHMSDKIVDVDSEVLFPKPSHEIYSPNSDLFTTATWYSDKSGYTHPDDEITRDYKPEIKQITPLLFPSFRETTTQFEIQRASKSMTVKASEDLPSVVTTTSFVSHTPALQPEVNTRFPYKGDDGVSPTPQVEEYAPSPRLTNPDCVNLPICLELTLRKTGWQDFCTQIPDIQAFLASSVSEYIRPIHPHQVILNAEKCVIESTVRDTTHVSTGFYVTDDTGEYDERLTEICGVILRKWAPTSFRNSIVEVKFYNSILQSTSIPVIPELNSGFIAAVAISAVAGVALCLLCILLVRIVMKHKLLHSRNSETTSPSADAYSLDSLSINASFRRRRTRRSARSYLNHAFNDQEIPSHPLNEKSLLSSLKNRDILEAEFKKIPMNMPKLDQIPEGAHVKNRYSNILPNPETRVVLGELNGDPLKGYINANYVKGYEGKAASYIACQAPLPDGIEDFWRMIWEQQSRVIVMLTLFEENGTSRCASYFPQSTLVAHPPYGDFQVSLLKKEVYEFYTVSTLRLLDMEKNLFRDIVHLWYTSWPDVGVPKDPSSFVCFMQQCRPYINCNSGPTIVHCSTGTGRTGVFLALDICMREYDQSRSVDILQCVSQLRRDRGGAVQNKDQYFLLHEALLEYISCAANQSQRPSVQSLGS